MRLVMLGTGPFAVPTLRALAASPHETALVITRPATGRKPEATPVERAATELGIKVWSPETVNSPEAQARMASIAADLLVVCDYGEILRPETLATMRLGGINLHGSLLPKYRGAAPVQWAILNGDSETGNSVIQMTLGLDAGPCLGQQRTPIEPDEDAAELEARLAAMGAELVLRIVDELARGATTPVPQDKALASKAPRLKKEQGIIDWSRSAQAIKNQVRGLRPWPRAYTFWHPAGGESVRINVDRVRVTDAHTEADTSPTRAGPGTVVQATERLLLATGDLPLEIIELQSAGKRSMTASEFLRGNRIRVGDSFGPQ
jgi:methionyl-tRNA formyltransferase